MDTGYEVSNFSRKRRPAWNEEFIQVGRRLDALTFASVAARRTDRSSARDASYEVAGYRQLTPTASANMTLQLTPDAEVLPQWRIAAGGEVRIAHWPKQADLWLVADGQYNHYSGFNTAVLKPGLKYAPGDDWQFQLQYIHVLDENNDHLFGWQARTDWQTPWHDVKLSAGVSNGPETEDLSTVRTTSAFAGFGLPLTDRVSVKTTYTRDVRKRSYIRDALALSLSVRL